MTETRYTAFVRRLAHAYEERFPLSGAAHARSQAVLTDGISHGARLFAPYPFRVTQARGAQVNDLDGHTLLDFWQGHYANILGHNPPEVLGPLQAQIARGWGLQTGLPDEGETAFAQMLCRATGAEQVRLTTAGTLATMYAIMLARAYTGRKVVLKVAGGWHGANPLALKGVARRANGFGAVDSEGVSSSTDSEIVITRFNDVEALEAVFAAHGEQLACFIFEPCPGGGGFIPATAEFMAKARALTTRYGAVMILDEVITGFRYCAGGVQKLYGVQADLSTFGKIIGGGMPISAVAGRADVMERASEARRDRVWFNGGTFAAHPLAMQAGLAMLEHLVTHEAELYPALAAKSQALFDGIERAFADRGVLARCTGRPIDDLPLGSSLGWVHFPARDDLALTSAEDLTDPALGEPLLREQALKLGLLLRDVNVMHGLGAVSTRHSAEDLARTVEAYDSFALELSRA